MATTSVCHAVYRLSLLFLALPPGATDHRQVKNLCEVFSRGSGDVTPVSVSVEPIDCISRHSTVAIYDNCNWLHRFAFESDFEWSGGMCLPSFYATGVPHEPQKLDSATTGLLHLEQTLGLVSWKCTYGVPVAPPATWGDCSRTVLRLVCFRKHAVPQQ